MLNIGRIACSHQQCSVGDASAAKTIAPALHVVVTILGLAGVHSDYPERSTVLAVFCVATLELNTKTGSWKI